MKMEFDLGFDDCKQAWRLEFSYIKLHSDEMNDTLLLCFS